MLAQGVRAVLASQCLPHRRTYWCDGPILRVSVRSKVRHMCLRFVPAKRTAVIWRCLFIRVYMFICLYYVYMFLMLKSACVLARARVTNCRVELGRRTFGLERPILLRYNTHANTRADPFKPTTVGTDVMLVYVNYTKCVLRKRRTNVIK